MCICLSMGNAALSLVLRSFVYIAKTGSLSHSCRYSILVEHPPLEMRDGSSIPRTGRDFFLIRPRVARRALFCTMKSKKTGA